MTVDFNTQDEIIEATDDYGDVVLRATFCFLSEAYKHDKVNAVSMVLSELDDHGLSAHAKSEVLSALQNYYNEHYT
jgi:hypothetical protein